ncbi:MAG: L,D-transpeptidase [Polyangiales bacterium]
MNRLPPTLACSLALALAGCRDAPAASSSATVSMVVVADDALDPGDVAPPPVAPPDAAPSAASAAAPSPDAAPVAISADGGGAPTTVRIVALRGWTPVRKTPQREGPLAGYLRAGAVVEVEDDRPVGTEECAFPSVPRSGWYRVRGGGYLCVGGNFAALAPARDFRTPTQPDFDASMPYSYAVSYGRSNMYRRIPTSADLRLYEPWRFRADASLDGGADEAAVAIVDAGRPDRPTLGELEGDPTSPVIRRMLTGMYVALDRAVRDSASGSRYLLTQSGGLVRDDRLSTLRTAPTFEGTALDATRGLPMAWMVSEFGWTYTVSPEGRVARNTRAPRLTPVPLADAPPLIVGNRTFFRTADGGAVLATNVRRATLRPPPEGVAELERWIDVDLDEQVLVAYEGARPVFTTLISSGRRTSRNAPERFETPAGSFRIQTKHVSTTMDGDTATDGPYSIEDVPWVMYFQGSYALHAAFWHSYYGWRMSHGCVNLSPPDARRVFLWADPQIPPGWHGVHADANTRPGSRVEIRHSRDNRSAESERPAGAARAVPEQSGQ